MAGEVQTIGTSKLDHVGDVHISRPEILHIPGLLELVALIKEGKVKIEQAPLPMTFQSQRALQQMERLTDALTEYGVSGHKNHQHLLEDVSKNLQKVCLGLSNATQTLLEKDFPVTLQSPDVHVRTHDTEAIVKNLLDVIVPCLRDIMSARQTITVHPVKMNAFPWVVFVTICVFLSVILWRVW